MSDQTAIKPEAISVTAAARRLVQAFALTEKTWAERLRKFDPRKNAFTELQGVVRYRLDKSITVEVATLEQWIAHQRKVAIEQSRPKTEQPKPSLSRYDDLIRNAEAQGRKADARAYRRMAAKGL